MKVFLLFLDGVGIGTKDARTNPFFAARLPVLTRLFHGRMPYVDGRRRPRTFGAAFAVDASLGLPGLPQSGTGQASIFTGRNAAALFGRHYGPFLPTSLRSVMKSEGLFARVVAAKKRAVLANAFPQRFFDYTDGATRRLSATTFASVSAGIPLLTARELSVNAAVSADFVRSRCDELGHPDIERVTAEAAGAHCAAIVEAGDLTVFDYWLTDHAGHRQDAPKAVRVLELLDEFLRGCLRALDLRRTLVLSVSDHGNIEDLSVKSHTTNPVLGFAVGRRGADARKRIRSLTDVAPFILECLQIPF